MYCPRTPRTRAPMAQDWQQMHTETQPDINQSLEARANGDWKTASLWYFSAANEQSNFGSAFEAFPFIDLMMAPDT